MRKVEPLPMPVVRNSSMKHREEAGGSCRRSRREGRKYSTPTTAERHDDEVPEGHARAAELVGEPAAEGPDDRADQRPEPRVLQRVDTAGTAT